MESLVKLFYEWEIQVLVLLSLMLQMFLFFAGSLRRRSINTFLRFLTWIAYLGADLVAVYTLGNLSRHEDVITGLAFFWAPFLLIHLGGQDTITAFAMEDNKLWLRHLLTLFAQAILALYVFWRSIGRHGVELLVSAVLVFAAGIIKYGERIWSLKCGSFESLEGSTGRHYEQQLPRVAEDAPYSHIVCAALHHMPRVLEIFTARSSTREDIIQENPSNWVKLIRLELGIMYDDLYTKSCVLRTRSGIILRCISQVCVLVALALFLASDKRRYNRADIAITCSLFIGCFLSEVCALFIFTMSPWIWAWLKVRRCNMLASLSWFLLCSDIGWPERKSPCLNSIGQYNLHRCLTSGSDQPMSCSRRVLTTVVKSLVNLVGVREGKILFWMSRLLDVDYVEADKETMECVVRGITDFSDEIVVGRQWPKLGSIVQGLGNITVGFGKDIARMHIFTEVHLRKYPLHPPLNMKANAAAAETATGTSCSVMVDVCRKLSNYMTYLLVTYPSMLPLNNSALDTLEKLQADGLDNSQGLFDVQPSMETLEELIDIWRRLLIYAAGKSRAEMHAAHLARGGELITFAWLLMSHNFFGDSELIKVQLTTNANPEGENIEYVFNFPPSEPTPSPDS